MKDTGGREGCALEPGAVRPAPRGRAVAAAAILAPHNVRKKALAEALSTALELPRRAVYQALLGRD